jgi:hypothetical protein
MFRRGLLVLASNSLHYNKKKKKKQLRGILYSQFPLVPATDTVSFLTSTREQILAGCELLKLTVLTSMQLRRPDGVLQFDSRFHKFVSGHLCPGVFPAD